MKKKKLDKNLMVLSLLSVITIFSWISLEVYHTLERPQPPSVPKEQLEPLDPKLTTEVVENLKQREIFSREDVIIVPVAEPTPEATQSAEVEQ